MTPRRAGLLAIACVVLAYASLAQGIGWNQSAHYALVRALAGGTAIVDSYRAETGDVAWVNGHYYSTKAPGLALLTLPVYVVLDGVGITDLMARVPGASSSTVGVLWALGLVGCVLPAALVLVLVRRLGDAIEPGFGVAAAVTAGLGTLLLPFATLFFAHVLSAALGFGAFALLWFERLRAGPMRLLAVGAAGLLGGLAITTEYPLAIVAAIVGLYALVAARWRGAVAYLAGGLLGVLPLALYNWLAFGSVTHLSYKNAVLTGGASGHDVLGANEAGFFGVQTPSFFDAISLLFDDVGLLRLAPVLALGAAGTVFLYRRGRRAEALVIGAVAIAFLVYNSGYVQPFGGFTPGPRFLIPLLPFLAVPLAIAYRRLPLTTLALALPSIVFMVGVTISGPLLAFDGRYWERIREGWFGGRSFFAILPFLLLVALALALAARATRFRFRRGEAIAAPVALAGWAFVALVAPRLLDDGDAGAVAALALAVAAAFAIVYSGVRVLLPQRGNS